MREAEGYHERANAAIEESKSYQQAQEKFAAFSRMGETSWGNEFYSFVRTKGVDPQHGVASASQIREFLQEFILSGGLGKDDNGNTFWVPHQGQGPNFVQGQLENITPKKLASDFESSAPGGGRGGVDRFHAVRDATVKSAQSAAGVLPTQTVDGTTTQNTVENHRALTESNIGGVRTEIEAQQGAAQQTADQRTRDVSPNHEPVYRQNPFTNAEIRNRALNPVPGVDGHGAAENDSRPFGPQADAKTQREGEEAARKRAEEAALDAQIEAQRKAERAARAAAGIPEPPTPAPPPGVPTR